MQLYLDRILAIALGSEDERAFSAIILVERIVRQGYANPRNVSKFTDKNVLIILI
jgi:hypothetical protein